MSDSDTKLEAISMLRFMPAGAANLGEDVTREDMRRMGFGPWSASCDRADDLSADDLGSTLGERPPMAMQEYDEVPHADAAEKEPEGTVVVMRFSGS